MKSLKLTPDSLLQLIKSERGDEAKIRAAAAFKMCMSPYGLKRELKDCALYVRERNGGDPVSILTDIYAHLHNSEARRGETLLCQMVPVGIRGNSEVVFNSEDFDALAETIDAEDSHSTLPTDDDYVGVFLPVSKNALTDAVRTAALLLDIGEDTLRHCVFSIARCAALAHYEAAGETMPEKLFTDYRSHSIAIIRDARLRSIDAAAEQGHQVAQDALDNLALLPDFEKSLIALMLPLVRSATSLALLVALDTCALVRVLRSIGNAARRSFDARSVDLSALDRKLFSAISHASKPPAPAPAPAPVQGE